MSAKYLVLSLGSNIEPREHNILQALQRLNRMAPLFETSDLVETVPWGITGQQDNYYNIVAVFEQCHLSPQEVLSKTQEIEQLLGRKRKGDYAPRTIDIDILFYDQATIQAKALTIPHPSWDKRPFVYRLLAQCRTDNFLSARDNKKLSGLMSASREPFLQTIKTAGQIKKIVKAGS